ncbi:Pleiotropic drug resistance protein 1 [Glycine soja]|nr:Pleiotropic drug resistance protein 1 [Glycine soja]
MEDLKWAALEKLPTYNRLRKGLLTTSRGVANEIDIADLGFQERQKLLNRLVMINVVEEDNEKFLLKLKERIDRFGIDMPTIEVRYEHLNVEAEAYVGNLLSELARREKSAKIKPDPDIDVYMKAAATRGQEASVVTDYVLKILGLDICADTMVGNEMLGSISGGQRKRVTTGEMLVGPTNALFVDEISTVLDSSTTFQIVRSLRQYVHILNGTAVISLVQPAPKTYELFDDIIFITEGQIVYQGLREYVLEPFESVGFKCRERKGVADFLQEATSRKDQEQYWAHRDEPHRFVTVTQFAEAFQSFHFGRIIREELATPFDKSKNHPAPLTTKRYGVDKKELLKANFSRGLLKQYLMLLLINQMASALFRVIAALGRNLVVASTCGYFALVVLFALGGFVLSIKDMKSWWIWGYWISPLMYEQNTIMVNEFLGNNWNRFTPNSNKTLGIQILESRGYFTHEYWYWIGIGALIGFMFLFNIIYTLALTYLTFGKPQTIIIEESEGDMPNGRAREDELTRLENSEITIEVVSSSREKKRGMVLPFEPYCITFDQIVYSVDMPQITVNNKGIVSGAFSLGVLTALMGVSGAGKTTLLDVLAGRKTGGNIEGNIKVSGYPKRQETFARISGYCEQNDIHSPHVTVYESLVYSAWLCLPAQVESNTRKNPLKNSLVGLPVNGLLTEQRKRLTIAVELVANPSIIFMDEPTSGLDARAAAIVMRTVRNTVDTGRTVVCTIHQPSIDIFEAFDELFLMKHGGQEMYVVPLGPHSSQLVKYFESIEGVSKIKDCYNPATWMLEVTTSAQELTLGVDFHEIYKNSELCRRNKLLIAKLGNPIPGSIPVWWRWFYRICPVAWTIYGLVASQFGDITNVMKSENESVQEFIRSYFGFKHDFIGVCAIMVSGFVVLFLLIFAVSIKPFFNFQRR